MSDRGICNWPPTWTKTGVLPDMAMEPFRGEIGTLDQVLITKISPYTRCYLLIKVAGEPYMGTLLFEDAAFCRQISELLQHYIGKSIRRIGGLDVSYLL
jgi:hypothetical protein